jgi:hypothetical protein
MPDKASKAELVRLRRIDTTLGAASPQPDKGKCKLHVSCSSAAGDCLLPHVTGFLNSLVVFRRSPCLPKCTQARPGDGTVPTDNLSHRTQGLPDPWRFCATQPLCSCSCAPARQLRRTSSSKHRCAWLLRYAQNGLATAFIKTPRVPACLSQEHGASPLEVCAKSM